MKHSKYHIGIEIDRLTNSIINTISGDSFSTEVLPITNEDLKGITKKNGWKFNWKSEAKLIDRSVYKLTIVENRNIIQGLISISDYNEYPLSFDSLHAKAIRLPGTPSYNFVFPKLKGALSIR